MTRTKDTRKKTKVARLTVTAPPVHVSAAVYEGALRARRAIKEELDPNLMNPNLFARYCYFTQIINVWDAQQAGNYLAD